MSRPPRPWAVGRDPLYGHTPLRARVLRRSSNGVRGRPVTTLLPGRTWARGRRGQALVELAIVLPVLLVIVGAAIDLGRLFQANVSIENAAREGAFFGSLSPRCDVVKDGCAEPETVDWHVRNELPGVTIDAPIVGCFDSITGNAKSVVDCVEDDVYRVTVNHQFSLLTPLLSPIFGSQLQLSATANSVVLNEAFDPDASPIPIPSGSTAPSTAPSTEPSSPPAGCTTAPAANFTFSQRNRNRPVEFTDTSTFVAGCPIVTWSWVFGDGTPNSSTQDPTHTYPAEGTAYQVTLTVTNGSGLSNTMTQTVVTQ